MKSLFKYFFTKLFDCFGEDHKREFYLMEL